MDSELDIIIRAISDVKSADDATKELVNRVFTKLKDGAIELPINSKLDKSELKKLDDNVRKARKAVVSKGRFSCKLPSSRSSINLSINSGSNCVPLPFKSSDFTTSSCNLFR